MRIRTRSIIIAVNKGVTQVVTLGIGIALVRIMPKDVLGSYRQSLLVVTLLAGLLGMNFPASLYYFIPKLGPDARRPLMSQTCLLSLLAAAVVAAVMYLAAGPIAGRFHNPELPGLLRAFCLYPFSHLILMLVPAFMISVDRPLRGGIYVVLRECIRAAVVLGLASMGQSLTVILSWLVWTATTLAVVAMLDMLRLSPGNIAWLKWKLLVEQMGYVLPMAAAAVVAVIHVQFDKLVISACFDPAQFAVYSCGAVQLPVVTIITASVFTAIMPDMVRMWAKGAKADMIRLWNVAVRKCALFVFPCFVILVVCSTDLIVLIFGEAYRQATWPFLVYLFILPIRVAVYGTILRATGNTRPIAVSAVTALTTNVVVTLTLVTLARAVLGPNSLLAFLGPSIGTVAATFTADAYKLVKVSRAIGVPLARTMPWKPLAVLMGLSAAAGLLAFVLPVGSLPVIVGLLIRSVVFVIVLLVLVLATGSLHDDEKRMLTYPLRLARKLLGRPRPSS